MFSLWYQKGVFHQPSSMHVDKEYRISLKNNLSLKRWRALSFPSKKVLADTHVYGKVYPKFEDTSILCGSDILAWSGKPGKIEC